MRADLVGATVTGAVGTASEPVVPPMLYLPCDGFRSGDEELSVDFRRMGDGRLALLAYTALDRLVNCCGQVQPWVVVPASALDELDRHQPYDVILLDVEIPTELRRKPGE
ncbi:MAG: SAV_915 family protein [Pseudonocardiaceae bacterium]